MYKICFFLPAAFALVSCTAQPTHAGREQKILFSGRTWTVRENTALQGPGPNYFKAGNVQVDKNGYLHLYIEKDPATGEWSCAEVTLDTSLGYGEYQFIVDGRLDKLDKYIVLGLFNYSGNDGLDEMDIEFARWGNDSFPNLNYTIWPAESTSKSVSATKEFSLLSNLSTHSFRRSTDSILCSSFDGTGPDPHRLIFSHNFKGSGVSISKLSMPVHMNLWLFEGHPPTTQKTVEVIVRSFAFKPGP